MSDTTDPARAYTDLCNSLRKLPRSVVGHDAVASAFSTEPWSSDFFEIVASIVRQGYELVDLVPKLGLDHDLEVRTITQIKQTTLCMSGASFSHQWDYAINNYLTNELLYPISMLSVALRATHSFPKLTEEEVEVIVADIDQLLVWLAEHQLVERDFVRHALIEGLRGLRFRLTRLSFVGWGYALDALKEVIGAYLALERGTVQDGSDPVAEAALKHVWGFASRVYERVSGMKAAAETADWMLRLYGAATATKVAGAGVVALLAGTN